MIKGSIKEDTTIVNIYAPIIRAAQYIWQILRVMKRKIDSNNVGDSNTPLTSVDKPSRQKIIKKLDGPICYL